MNTISRHPTRLAALAVAGLLALGACGGAAEGLSADAETGETTVTPAADEPDTESTASDSEVFDSSFIHEISLEFDEAGYLTMIDAYAETGDKEWIEANVTIDGTTYEQVGIRLKDNSSLFGLSTDGTGPASGLTADDPEELPWLIRLDKFVDGQDHEGVTDFVVRSNTTETSLNEAVALELLDAAGLASQDAMAVRFGVNGSAETLRLVIENLDDVWMEEEFDDDGALYKAESAGDYSYRGDDPDSYAEVFDQEAGDDNADLTPLIEFLDFVNNSDDETFAAEIDDWLDTESFATYLAMQDLVENFDDIDGPGNNSYLYYDTTSGQFTVVPWDLNLAFGATNDDGGAPGPGGLGGGFPSDGAPAESGDTATGDARPAPGDGGTGEVPATPGDLQLGQRRPTPGDNHTGGPPTAPAGGGPGALGGSNVLVERFLAVEEYTALYQNQLTGLDAELFDSGEAAQILAEWVAVLEAGASDLVSADLIAREAAALGIAT